MHSDVKKSKNSLYIYTPLSVDRWLRAEANRQRLSLSKLTENIFKAAKDGKRFVRAKDVDITVKV